jgi:hypothetical protein
MAAAGTTKVLSFDEAIKESGPRIRTVLLGNGFSVAQAGGQFAYTALLQKSGLANNDPIQNIFKLLNTFDFERVMRALEDAAQIERAYGEKDRSKRFMDDAARVRDALIAAVHAVHPGVQFDIPKQQRDACAVRAGTGNLHRMVSGVSA